MSQSDPIVILISAAVCAYVGWMWYGDFQKQRMGEILSFALPGARTTSVISIVVAVIGAVLIVAGETLGEYALNISHSQTNITVLFLVSMITASFVEELIFRGYLVVQNRGRLLLVFSIVGFSLVFALLHPYIWNYKIDDGHSFWNFSAVHFSMNLETKAIFSTSVIFINSLWFYTVRFYTLNPNRSLIPCFAAHLTSNLSVFFIKLVQGHVTALY